MLLRGPNIMPRIAILISGRGSNMQRLVEVSQQNLPMVEIVLVASNAPCAGIEFARDHGLTTATIERSVYASRADQETALAQTLVAAAPDWIFLAGYMAVLSAKFVAQFAGKILNIHPSLLPDFKGLDTHERALSAGVAQHGASVHMVTAALDDGPVILQAGLTIAAGEDAKSLAAKVLGLEHQLYPFVLSSLATGALVLTDGAPYWQPREQVIKDAPASSRHFLETTAIWPAAR